MAKPKSANSTTRLPCRKSSLKSCVWRNFRPVAVPIKSCCDRDCDMPEDTHRAIDAIWRIESPRLIAGLTRLVRDIARAEDLAQDALVLALEQWPKTGIPDNPGAWLMATAKHRAIDPLRRNTRLQTKLAQLAPEIAEKEQAVPDYVTAIDDNVGDDLLRLVFISCHPILSTESQLALTLRMLGGLTTDEIARAFLVPEPTIAQRIVRAKR